MWRSFCQTILERGLAAKFAGVSLIGFAVDVAILRLGVGAGLEPAWARVISLVSAMQTTFLINGLLVFGRLTPSRLPRQWIAYMASNGVGNFCNYWIFVTLVSLHWRIVSDHLVALSAGSFAAWMINFAGARFLVFGAPRRRRPTRAPSNGPSPA
jgi:putative flippase GtrA